MIALLLVATACGDKPAGQIAFVPEETSHTGPSVSLRLHELTDTQLVVDVVGVGLVDLYGLAFRLRYATVALHFVSMSHEPSPAARFWPEGPATLAMATEGPAAPGLVLAGITRRGQVAGGDTASDPAAPTILARLTFTRLSKSAETSLTFQPIGSAAIRSTGERDPTARFVGARLERR